MNKLVRRPDEGWCGGVCAGIAHTLGLDVKVVRALAVASIFTGAGLWIYGLAWLLLPDDSGRRIAARKP